MNKTELVDAIAEKSGLPKTQAARALDAFIETVTDSLTQGESVTVIGFGTFLVREREARTGRNPQTREAIEIPASRLPAFKAGKGLKDAVNTD